MRCPLVALLAVGAFTAVVGGASEPPDDSVIGVIPFETPGEPNRIMINLAPERNRPLRMMLDTGATFSVLTPLVARSLGVTVRPLKSSPYRRATSLGRDLQFYVDTSTSDSGSKTGWEYGLLGGNFLAEYVVEIDFSARVVRFLDPAKFKVPKVADAENEAVVPLRVVSGRPIAKISMNDKKLPVLLDTGAPGTVILSGKAASKLDVDVDSLQPFGTFGTVKGPMPVKFYETDSFTLGGYVFGAMPVMVAPKGWYNQGTNSDSVAGYDVLSQFTIRIDYPRERMWLRRESSDVRYMGVNYAKTRHAGVFLHPGSDRYWVVGVLPDSPAAMIGLSPNDIITLSSGEGPTDLEEVLAKVVSGDRILVERRQADGEWARVLLPEATMQRIKAEAAGARGESRP